MKRYQEGRAGQRVAASLPQPRGQKGIVVRVDGDVRDTGCRVSSPLEGSEITGRRLTSKPALPTFMPYLIREVRKKERSETISGRPSWPARCRVSSPPEGSENGEIAGRPPPDAGCSVSSPLEGSEMLRSLTQSESMRRKSPCCGCHLPYNKGSFVLERRTLFAATPAIFRLGFTLEKNQPVAHRKSHPFRSSRTTKNRPTWTISHA